MNTPNPLHPQGAFPDARGRSHIRIAIFTILAIHVVLLGALLLQGCKKNPNDPGMGGDASTALPPFAPTTNVVAPPPEIAPFAPPPEVAKFEPPPVPPVPPGGIVEPPPPPPVPPGGIVETPPTPPGPVPPAGPDREHIVSKGDSFFTLAKQYGVTSKAIADANPGVDSRRLKLKQKLKIPAAVASPAPAAAGSAAEGTGIKHVVKSGDTLTSLAKKYGTTAKALRRENNLKTDRLVVDQKLKVPAPTAKAAKAPAKAPDNGTASAPK